LNLCCCGTQSGYPHPPRCPFPYYGRDDATITRWHRAADKYQADRNAPALTHETAPDLATALAGLLECCEDSHDDETHEDYGGPHDPSADCMVCAARAALARHRGERFPPTDDARDPARVLSLKPGDAFRVEDGTVWRVCHGPDVPGHYNAVGAGDFRATIAVTRIVECL
jgi:hypothetical protein